MPWTPPPGGVEGGAVRDMAVAPGGVAALRCAGGVEPARLGQEHEGALGMGAVADGRLSGGDHARPVAVARQPPPVAGGQPVAGDAQELAWGHIEQDRASLWQLRKRPDLVATAQLAAQLT